MSTEPDPVLAFNAGYTDYDEKTHVVTCRPGSGRITVVLDEEDPYLYFSWSPRDGFVPPESYKPFDSYVLVPGDAKWVHVKQCTSGRVFALKFESSEKREFFWMQSKTDKGNKPGDLSKEDKKVLQVMEKLLDEKNLDRNDGESGPQGDDAPVPGATVIA